MRHSNVVAGVAGGSGLLSRPQPNFSSSHAGPLESFCDDLGDFARQVDRDCEDLQRSYKRAEKAHLRQQNGTNLGLSVSGYGETTQVEPTSMVRSKVEEVKKLLESLEETHRSIRPDVPLAEIMSVVTGLRESNDARIQQIMMSFEGDQNMKKARRKKKRRSSVSSSSGMRRRRNSSRDSTVVSDGTPLRRADTGEMQRAKTRGPNAADSSCILGLPVPLRHGSGCIFPFDELPLKPAEYPKLDTPPSNGLNKSLPWRADVCQIPTLHDCGLSNEALAILQQHEDFATENLTPN